MPQRVIICFIVTEALTKIEQSCCSATLEEHPQQMQELSRDTDRHASDHMLYQAVDTVENRDIR